MTPATVHHHPGKSRQYPLLRGCLILAMLACATPVRAGAILNPDALRAYVASFNSQRPDDTSEGLPGDGSVTAIRNNQAAAWMEKNVPLFECSDKDIEEIYHFRWWTYRKHIWKTPDGVVVSEFLPQVSWSKKHNTINSAAGHHLAVATSRSCGTRRAITTAVARDCVSSPTAGRSLTAKLRRG